MIAKTLDGKTIPLLTEILNKEVNRINEEDWIRAGEMVYFFHTTYGLRSATGFDVISKQMQTQDYLDNLRIRVIGSLIDKGVLSERK